MSLAFTPPTDPLFVAPAFELLGTDRIRHALTLGTPAVVVFMCNHCPYVQRVLPRMSALAAWAAEQGMDFVGINSNDAVRYPADSFEAMQELTLPFPYLHDADQSVAHAYGAVCTPDLFLFDAAHRLVYRGRMDDSPDDAAAVTREELKEAMTHMLAGETVPVAQPSHGCDIKWRV